MLRVLVTGVVVVASLFPSTGARAQTGAKALFYGSAGSTIMPGGAAPGATSRLGTGLPATGAAVAGTGAPQEYMGVSYWVDLVDSQGRRRVTSDHVFRAGDRIKLGLRTNRDGYLYLINLGSTGRTHTLFPTGAVGEASNFVRANTVYEMPPGGFLRFDSNPGEEVVILLLAPQPMGPGLVPAASAPPAVAPVTPPPPPPPAAAPGSSMVAGSPQGAPAPPRPGTAATASVDDTVRDLWDAVAQLEKDRPKGAKAIRGAKDLIVEVDSSGPAPATYAVAPVSALRDGSTISFQIRLRHQ